MPENIFIKFVNGPEMGNVVAHWVIESNEIQPRTSVPPNGPWSFKKLASEHKEPSEIKSIPYEKKSWEFYHMASLIWAALSRAGN